MGSRHLIMHNVLIFFWFSVRTMRLNDFSLILIQGTLIRNLLQKLRLTKLFPFIDVLIDNCNNILNTTTYHKSTYSGLLLNFNSFTSCFYIISLIKCLVDCGYKVNNTWASFNNVVTKIKGTLKRNSFSSFLQSFYLETLPHPFYFSFLLIKYNFRLLSVSLYYDVINCF